MTKVPSGVSSGGATFRRQMEDQTSQLAEVLASRARTGDTPRGQNRGARTGGARTAPNPSPHKFGVSLIKWQSACVRICGERGASVTGGVSGFPPARERRIREVVLLSILGSPPALIPVGESSVAWPSCQLRPAIRFHSQFTANTAAVSTHPITKTFGRAAAKTINTNRITIRISVERLSSDFKFGNARQTTAIIRPTLISTPLTCSACSTRIRYTPTSKQMAAEMPSKKRWFSKNVLSRQPIPTHRDVSVQRCSAPRSSDPMPVGFSET